MCIYLYYIYKLRFFQIHFLRTQKIQICHKFAFLIYIVEKERIFYMKILFLLKNKHSGAGDDSACFSIILLWQSLIYARYGKKTEFTDLLCAKGR